MKRKLLILIMLACFLFGCVSLFPLAADNDDSDLILIFEENFEEYEKDVNVSSTLMPNFFVCDANAIGDGVIHVQESASGNLYLKSHVFTQIYSATPIVGAYEFSLDVHEAQGQVQTGVFIRAPKTVAAYYEADGHPDTSVCQAGLFLYTNGSRLGVNVKTYDENAASTARLQNNTVYFPLPEGASYPYNLRVADSGTDISIYVNDTLICRVTFTNPGQVYGNHESEGKFFGEAKLLDAEGNEKGTYTNPLMSSDAAYIGWTTRAADMIVDNVTVKVEAAYQAVLTIHQLPAKVTEKNLEDAKELVAAARAMYDALPEDKRALVVNFAKLSKTESAIEALENVTEAPTEAPTEEPTEAPSEVPTEPSETPSEAPTDAITQPSETPTETLTDPFENTEFPENGSGESGEVATEELTDAGSNVKTLDDSLALWILIAIMIVAVCGTAGYITVKVRK